MRPAQTHTHAYSLLHSTCSYIMLTIIVVNGKDDCFCEGLNTVLESMTGTVVRHYRSRFDCRWYSNMWQKHCFLKDGSSQKISLQHTHRYVYNYQSSMLNALTLLVAERKVYACTYTCTVTQTSAVGLNFTLSVHS